MVVIFYIIIAKCSYKVRIVCFICIQIKTAASLSAFFHATGNKVFKSAFWFVPITSARSGLRRRYS